MQTINSLYSKRVPMNLFPHETSYNYNDRDGCRLFEDDKAYEFKLHRCTSIGNLSFEEFRSALQDNKLDSSLVPWRMGSIINYSNHLGEDEFGYSRYETCDVLFCPVMKEEYGSIDYKVLCKKVYQ